MALAAIPLSRPFPTIAYGILYTGEWSGNLGFELSSKRYLDNGGLNKPILARTININ